MKKSSWALWVMLVLFQFPWVVNCGASAPTPTKPKKQELSCSLGSCEANEYCEPGSGCKKRCYQHKDCAGNKEKPFCHRASGRCVECAEPSHCKKGYSCRRYRCFRDITCRSSKHCGQQMVCAFSEQKCVECLNVNDCQNGFVCEQGICTREKPRCISDKECKAFGQICDVENIRCVDCLGDHDCPGKQFCHKRVCEWDRCIPRKKRCGQDPGVIEQCKDNGSGWKWSSRCPKGSTCLEGRCVTASTQGTETSEETSFSESARADGGSGLPDAEGNGTAVFPEGPSKNKGPQFTSLYIQKVAVQDAQSQLGTRLVIQGTGFTPDTIVELQPLSGSQKEFGECRQSGTFHTHKTSFVNAYEVQALLLKKKKDAVTSYALRVKRGTDISNTLCINL